MHNDMTIKLLDHNLSNTELILSSNRVVYME